MKAYKITACSSEDPVHLSSNLKNSDLYRFWQTNGYVQKASVDISFDKPTKIQLIEIGNAGSAFVEILGGKEGAKPDEEMPVLVPIKSVMSVHESKNGSNRNKVVTITSDKFTASLAGNSWVKLRFVCNQPFCKDSPFGLSYISINQSVAAAAASSPSSSSTSKPNTLQDTDVDMEEPKSAKRSKSEAPPLNPESSKTKKYQIQDDSDNEEQARSPITITKKVATPIPADKKTKKRADTTTITGSDSIKSKPPLKGVVLVISGIQHPERGAIRDKAVELGAQYKSDWDKECTHLICKFANKMKYTEVKSKGGIIALPQWIFDCHTKNKKLAISKKYTLEEDRPSLSSDSTAEKKKKKKKATTADPTKGYDSDPNDDDDGKPNDYDYNDSFIDNNYRDHNGDDDYEPDSDEIQTSDEDVDELLRESKRIIKQGGGLTKRPRDYDLRDPYELEEENDERKKQQKIQHKPNKEDSGKGKTFAKQQNNKINKPQSSESKPSKPKHTDSEIRNDSDDARKPVTKPAKSQKPKKPIKEEGNSSGTEEMADADVKKQFENLNTSDAPMANDKAKLKKGKMELPNDAYGSGTEEMQEVDFPRGKGGKTGTYHSDDSDSDGTQPLDRSEFQNVLGALGQGGSEATQFVDGDVDWESKLNSMYTDQNKAKEHLGKSYPVKELPDFLTPVQAFLSGVGRKNEPSLRRYIIAYNGKIDDYLGNETKYIFTEKSWDKNFNNALQMNPSLLFVKPEWIFECHQKQKLVDPKNYVITKS